MNQKKYKWLNCMLIGVLGMSWFHMILRAYGLPVKRPLAAVQQLVINNGADPQSLDPHKTVGDPEQQIISDLLEGLFILNREGEVVPGMALHAYSPDKRSWSFNIRRGAKWSNGDPLDARDFVYSWRRLADPKTASPCTHILQSMRIANIEEILAGKLPPDTLGIEAIGPLTLRITLAQPLGFLKQMLVHSSLRPVHRATIEQHGSNWTRPGNWVGNGAYCPKERVVGEKIVLTRNPNYWDNDQTIIDQVTYLSINNEEAEIAGYQTSDIHMTSELGSLLVQGQKLQQKFPKELRQFQDPSVSGYQLNTKIPPFNDVRVRQALNLALDRQTITQQLFIPGQSPAYNVVPDGLGGLTAYQPHWMSWSSEQRLQTAKKLLQAAGYGPHNPLRFTLLYNTGESNKQWAVTVSALWKASLDVEVTLLNQEWKIYLEETRRGNYQMARFCTFTTYPEPFGLLCDYLSHSCCNETGYNNPNFDYCLDKVLDIFYATERHALYHKAEAQLAEDVPVIPISHPIALRLIKPYIGGLSDRNNMNIFYTKDLYITKHPLAPKKPRS